MPKRKADDTVNDEATVVKISKSKKRKANLLQDKERDSVAAQLVQMKDVKTVSLQDAEVHLPRKKKKKKKIRANEDPVDEEYKDSEFDSVEVKLTSQKKLKSKGFVLFVGQIPHHVTKKDIERHFANVGGVKDVRLLIYPDSGRSRGCAYVEFLDQKHRTAAFKLNESTLGGGKIRIEFPYQGGKKYKKNKTQAKNLGAKRKP